ncbi:MAG: hypothetical protein CVV41_21700 [Candidatus Riflebacteria bacterium HGW-Riflebacteria-1]|jgi:hypothetical protein|nr:MAG: hypothetical protein CVV41_21700 [Candidatus Riflebacteria bacterium HGW-Riflebacteria-1]
MTKLVPLLLAALFVAFNPVYAQYNPSIPYTLQVGLLKAVGFGFQGSAYKSLAVTLWTPGSAQEAEPSEAFETPVTTTASGTENASATESAPSFRKSERQMRLDQRLQSQRQSGEISGDDSGAPQKSDLQRRLDQRLANNRQPAGTAPRKSESQLKYDQRLRQGRRLVPGGADQPPIEIAADSDGDIVVNGVEYTLRFVFFQNDFSSFSADVFSVAAPNNSGDSRGTSSLEVPIGNLRLEKAPDYKATKAYIGSLSLNDDETGISGKFEVWLNDMSGR